MPPADGRTPPWSNVLMEDSDDIVRRIRDGDESAWEAFYLRFRDRLLCSIRLRLGAGLRGHLESEDILHSVVREALDDLGGFESRGPGSLTRYLNVRVLNKIRKKHDYFAAARRARTAPLTDSLAGRLPGTAHGELHYLDADRYERLERALRAMPERSREAVLLRLVEGATNADVAARLGVGVDAASKIYSRALARLAVAADAAESP